MPAPSPRPPASRVRCGCAGWSLPAAVRDAFGPGDSVLQRYATRFDAVEINSSFYRPHQPATYARWADSVPADFRFSVKLPRSITHDARLYRTGALLDGFLAGAGALGERLGRLLVQLPPSLAFDPRRASTFFGMLRRRWPGGVACEPRHPGWFTPAATALLDRHRIARVVADPPIAVPGPATATQAAGYWRWHGAPRIYYSCYDEAALQALAAQVQAQPAGAGEAWVIFDNTAAGEAVPNALQLQARLAGGGKE